ncbi:MAG: glycosyltransferase [Bacteroidales bacterium]|nr:glycosyltransferase [Bacteroidales bacterium]
MNTIQASVIISFYNKIEWLRLVLSGFEIQTYKNFEILIADDGSNKETTDQLKEYIKNSSLRIKHIWHEDQGWRKTEILNKSVVASQSDYIIFIDGDCIPHSHFVEEHIKNRKTNCALAGRRVNLSEEITRNLTPEIIIKRKLEKSLKWKMVFHRLFRKKGSHVENAFYIKNRQIRKKINNKRKGILGCNFSLYKKDLLAVNGFDERYKAPAVGEDSDLRFRLELNGTQIIPVKHLAIQYHLFHPQLKRGKENLIIFEETQKNKITYTPYGINKE